MVGDPRDTPKEQYNNLRGAMCETILFSHDSAQLLYRFGLVNEKELYELSDMDLLEIYDQTLLLGDWDES